LKLEVLGPGPKSLGLKPLWWYMEQCLNQVGKTGEFLVVSALTDAEGLNLLYDAVGRVINLGGNVKAVIGIDLSIAYDALQKLGEVFGDQNVFIYNNPADSTFHPKMYIIRIDDSTGIIIVGSSNLTHAGFLDNFETNVAISFDLHNIEEKRVYDEFISIFTRLTKEKSTRLLTKELTLTLEKKAKRIRKIPKRETQPKLSQIFQGKSHGWKIPKFQGKTAFLMTLSYNDVSGVRGDQYIRIPVKAIDANNTFWGWPKSFVPSARAKYPERLVDISFKGKKSKNRFYFAKRPDEFRLVMPEIYALGAAYEGSILEISRHRNLYSISLILKKDKRFGQYFKQCTEKCLRGKAKIPKVWGYI